MDIHHQELVILVLSTEAGQNRTIRDNIKGFTKKRYNFGQGYELSVELEAPYCP